MQKLINAPADFVDQVLEGLLIAHPDCYTRPSRRVLLRAKPRTQRRVGIATGGGSGHLPLFLGYVGAGLADGVAIGEVFASPSAEDMLNVLRAVDGGGGVLQLFGNYGGDVINFGLAAELAQAEGIRSLTITAKDDVASAPKGEEQRRRGIAGIFFLYKVAGAMADQGADLEHVAAVTERAAADLRSMGVALAPCTIPASGVPTFSLPSGEMEIGMGIHGEPGVRRGPLQRADAVAEYLVDAILRDLAPKSGERFDILINGLGATPKEELYILLRGAARRIGAAGHQIRRTWVGEFATSLEMAGASISLLCVDDELAGLLDAPVSAPLLCLV